MNTPDWLTAEYLKEMLYYDPETGVWTWLTQKSANIKPGQVAGSIRSDGYRQIAINRTMHYAHRLSWLYMTGEWPKNQVDHINRDRDDNRWDNLRAATPSDNSVNSKLSPNNTSGYRGVSWDQGANKWGARVNNVHLGFFDDIKEAVAVRDLVAVAVQGSFAVLNNPIIGGSLDS